MSKNFYTFLVDTNGYVFSVNMSYNNDKDRDVMLKAWRESLLKKSDV